MQPESSPTSANDRTDAALQIQVFFFLFQNINGRSTTPGGI